MEENVQRSTFNIQRSTINPRALFIASLLIVMVAIWLGLKIPRGILTYQDELFTAERAREMLVMGRDSVYYNFQHSFAKPPLQYWLTTLTLPRIANSATAVRIWPLIYGLLTAVAVSWLAFFVSPKRPWLIPLSVAILVSCPLFSTEATHALLDTGLMFFTTVAIGLAELARRHPEWWLGLAIICWLGALQKIPLILLVWLILVLVRFSSKTERVQLRNSWLIGSAFLAIVLVAIWPVFQYAKYGMPVTRAFAGDDLSALYGTRRLGSRPFFEVLSGLVATGWAGGIFALAAAISCLFRLWVGAIDLNRPSQKPLSSAGGSGEPPLPGAERQSCIPPLVREMSILSLAIIALAVIFYFRSVRYVLPIIPSLSLVLAYFLHRLAERSEKMRFGAIAFVALFVLGGFVQAEIKMHHRGPDPSREQQVAQKLGELQHAGVSTLLVSEGPSAKRTLRSTPFYLFHGALRFPLQRFSLDNLRRQPPSRPVVGVCDIRDFPAIQNVYPEVEIAFALDQFTCWRTAAKE